MDIVVTIPKSEYDNDDKETAYMMENQNEVFQFWVLKKVPKQLQEGDRIYFVKHGQIDSSMVVKFIETAKLQKCDVTGREWYADCLIWMQNLRDETNLNIKIKGFQGFRYKWWED